jgi:hypothetical protein
MTGREGKQLGIATLLIGAVVVGLLCSCSACTITQQQKI